MKGSGYFSVAIKQESLFLKWDLTTFNLLMNQFHSSKKISYSGYWRVRSDGGSLIALGGKIPDVFYIVAKLTTFCLGRSPQMIHCCMLHPLLHELRNSNLAGFEYISEWNKTSFYWNYFVFFFFVSERILYILIFSRTKRCLASEDT